MPDSSLWSIGKKREAPRNHLILDMSRKLFSIINVVFVNSESNFIDADEEISNELNTNGNKDQNTSDSSSDNEDDTEEVLLDKEKESGNKRKYSRHGAKFTKNDTCLWNIFKNAH